MARPFVELYINNQKVYFKEPPEIFVTYAHTDLHNPTVVKNSYTKTVTVEGTPENNRIFNDFYDMKRMNNGELFNASRKETFVLYRNGEPMETGYVKLDKVNKKGNRVTYDITLYGGLGQFLYNLQYKEDGEQMKLSDLEYNVDFNFEVNKDTVKGAWQHITGMKEVDEVYDTLNFAPCYNGIPENFSADKVAINVESFESDEDLYNSFVKSKDGYSTVDGWILGELNKEYDEWQTGDLRSYLQRPVVRFKEIISAVCNPNNNGGYTVNLDEDFFNSENPYYENAWMTLPLITEVEDERGEITVLNNNSKYYVEGGINGDTIKITMIVSPAITADTTSNVVKTGKVWSVEVPGLGDYTGYPFYNFYRQNIGRCMQVVARDKNGKVIGGSGAQAFYTSVAEANDFTFSLAYKAPITHHTGEYQRTADNLFAFNTSYYEFTAEVKYEEGMYFELYQSYDTIPALGDNTYSGCLIDSSGNGIKSYNYYYGTYSAGASLLKTSRIVTKKRILNTEKTPCDYFLSYLKMFNLHIWKDMYDDIIYVRKRPNFFTGDIKDIEDLVDRGSDITIKPLTFENKWLNFKVEYGQDEQLHKDYKDEYGLEYGIQKVDTNYAFDSSSKDLLENYVFKGCVTARKKSKYYISSRYTEANSAFDVPSFYLDGFKTYLYNSDGDTTEGSSITPRNAHISRNWWTQKYYDFMPKPSFTNKENKAVDGAGVLLFFNGKQLMRDKEGKTLNFYITDDIPQFAQLNDSEPCWIWTYDTKIATDTTIGGSPYYGDGYIPMFSRYITNENGWVTHSWDFGTPKALYIPDYSIDGASSIYTQYWQPYMRDQYDANTRVVECRVLLIERVVGDWLQNFYYWDGRYWVLNKITDYNPVSNGTTKCEFISVNDMSNYLS